MYHGDGALAGDDVHVVERRLADPAGFVSERFRPLPRAVVGFAGKHHIRAEPLDRLDLDARGRLRQLDQCLHTEFPYGQRHTLRVIAGRCGDHPAVAATQSLRDASLLYAPPSLKVKIGGRSSRISHDLVVHAR